jgi:hypothetical protein
MMLQLRNWQETVLWAVLEQKNDTEAKDVQHVLSTWMDRIQTVLQQASTTPLDFSLHDAQHSFRVAEWMAELIPQDVLVAISSYEIGLLLFSAYLHDIGMTPEQARLKPLIMYLLSGESDTSSTEPLDSFLAWLDDIPEDVTIPLTNGTPTPDAIRKSNLLVAHYARAKHVDWGLYWIEEHLRDARMGTYVQWVDDLKVLCKSHHQDYHALAEKTFDPKPVGSHGSVVHLRYLASVLRVADILDFDPERTPEILYLHRNISPGSAIYWEKDHPVTRRIDNGRLTIAAEPADARIHRAIDTMIDAVSDELRLVRRLDDERRFSDPGFPGDALPHRWDILPDIHRRVRPKNGAYEYIDGAFRPDTKKLLELLSGRALYSNDLDAVRELVQNSFDAVREQIALERLARKDPSHPKWEDILGELHSVELSLLEEDGRIWLACNDDGVGMSKAIITKYLLVSGAAHRGSFRTLERRCREAGFTFLRTGKFGIGVLSYFMLADLVEITTRRSSLTDDAEATGWLFETEGVGSFGELRPNQSLRPGTNVRFRLSEKYVKKVGAECLEGGQSVLRVIGGRIAQYLTETIVRSPFALRLSIQERNDPEVLFSTDVGWTNRDLLQQVENAATRDDDLFFWEAIKTTEYAARIRWFSTEGKLPDGLGSFRIHVPLFFNQLGVASVFLDTEIDSGRIVIPRASDGGNAMIHSNLVVMSWKGIRLRLPSRYFGGRDSGGVITEVDWASDAAGVLSANRGTISLEKPGKRALIPNPGEVLPWRLS